MKKKIIKILSVALASVFILVAVYRLFILPKIFDRGQKHQNSNYPSLVYEYEVSKKLQELNIPHKIDKDGTLRYSSLYQEAVDRTYEEVNDNYFPEWSNIAFSNEEYRNQFISLLKENNIPFIIRKLDASGQDYVLWDPKYDEQGTALMKKVETEMLNNMKQKNK